MRGLPRLRVGLGKARGVGAGAAPGRGRGRAAIFTVSEACPLSFSLPLPPSCPLHSETFRWMEIEGQEVHAVTMEGLRS